MPHTVLQIAGSPDSELARDLCQTIETLIHRVLGKQPEVMSTVVQYISADLWFVGGKTLAEQGKTAYQLDISITDETNTKADKARFLREVHAAIVQRLPHAHDTSYVHLVDARASAYGYGGHTQEWRHQQAGV